MVTRRLHGDRRVSLLAGVEACLRKRSTSPLEVSAVRRTRRPWISAPPKDLLHLLQLVANREFHPRVPECRRKLIAEKVERCLGGRDTHSREGSHALEGISRCQNLQGRAHLSQQETASGRWSARLDQHQDKLDPTHSHPSSASTNRSTAQFCTQQAPVLCHRGNRPLSIF